MNYLRRAWRFIVAGSSTPRISVGATRRDPGHAALSRLLLGAEAPIEAVDQLRHLLQSLRDHA